MQNAEQLFECAKALIECGASGNDPGLVVLEQLLQPCALVFQAGALGAGPVQKILLLVALLRETRLTLARFL